MSKVKLTYFEITAIGEPIRFLLHHCGVQFEDERLDREQFMARKEGLPFGKVPVLEIDGMKMHQMVVICRYLGQKFGLAGKNEREALECEMLGGSIGDLRALIIAFYWEAHPEAQEQKRLANIPRAHFFLKRFDDIVNKNGGHFVNGQLTWVDFLFAGQADNLSYFVGSDLYTDYPNLKALRDKIFDLPAVKKYMETRPATKF